MKKKTKHILIAVILICFLLTGGIVTSYFGARWSESQHDKSPILSVSQQPAILKENKSWKTYHGDDFSFQYPKDWAPEGSLQNINGITFWPSNKPHIYPDVNHGGNSQMIVKIDTSPWTWDNIHDKQYYPETYTTTVGKRDAVRFSPNSVAIRMKNEQGLLLINTNEKDILNEILSTFTFFD